MAPDPLTTRGTVKQLIKMNRVNNREAGKTEEKRPKWKERMNEGKTYGRSKDGIEEKRERRMQEEKGSNKRQYIRMSK
jgi:hypothetical protein